MKFKHVFSFITLSHITAFLKNIELIPENKQIKPFDIKIKIPYYILRRFGKNP